MSSNEEAIKPAEEADDTSSSAVPPWRKVAWSLVDHVRCDPARWGSVLLVSVASAALAAWLLNIGRHQWFVTDEFDYFNSEHESLIAWLLSPHNEHTITFTKAWFALLANLVGLRHYVLYMIPLVATHLVVVAAIYRSTWIATASRVMATVTALVALAMGAAAGTLTWAGQLQYTGSVAVALLVILLAVQSSGNRARVIAIVLTLFGTLNGTAFLAFALAASVVYARRRLWPEAVMVAAIPVGWELVSRLVWGAQDPFAAHGLGQILREGPAFAYSFLDTAISQTVGDTHLSSAVMAALVLGTLALISASPGSRCTALSGRVVGVLALAAILTMLSLEVARIALGTALASSGGYSYLFLVSLLPVGGILLGHVARSKAALLGTASVFVTIALIGVTTISDDAAALGSWKISGEHLMQTAAAELEGDMPTFADEIPAPDTAPTVNQDRLRSLVMTGQLDAVITGTVDADQASLNMQWRIVSIGQTLGICRDLPAGESFAIPVGGSMSMSGLNPGAAVDLRYSSSDAVRQFQVPATAVGLQTLSQRTAEGTVETAPVRVCSSGT